MKLKRFLFVILALLGITLILVAIFLFPGEAQKKAAGLCYGFGSAALGLGLAWFAGTFLSALQNEQVKRRKSIAMADERNKTIQDKAGAMVEKYTTYGLILWIMAASILVTDLAHILPPIILLVLRFFLLIYHTNRLMKEM